MEVYQHTFAGAGVTGSVALDVLVLPRTEIQTAKHSISLMDRLCMTFCESSEHIVDGWIAHDFL